ncbi:fructosamine kinase family protein [Mycobacterium sp. URHB0021]|jgi:fructosamine-3-kinase
MAHFVKHNPNSPAGFFACEAAGLQWLSAADGGVRCARVIATDEHTLTLERLQSARPTRQHAHEFGRRLACTHDAGASAFGAPPDGWTGSGFFGPLQQPLPMSLVAHDVWGAFYARERLAPMAERAAPRLSGETQQAVTTAISRCWVGDFDDDDRPARIHGDLWSGNVMWTPDGVVLIDPAAHGGHRETDLAMLALFGCPYFDEVVEGYQDQRALRDGWRERVGLHQLYPLLAHVALFGGGYEGQTRRAALEAVGAS